GAAGAGGDLDGLAALVVVHRHAGRARPGHQGRDLGEAGDVLAAVEQTEGGAHLGEGALGEGAQLLGAAAGLLFGRGGGDRSGADRDERGVVTHRVVDLPPDAGPLLRPRGVPGRGERLLAGLFELPQALGEPGPGAHQQAERGGRAGGPEAATASSSNRTSGPTRRRRRPGVYGATIAGGQPSPPASAQSEPSRPSGGQRWRSGSSAQATSAAVTDHSNGGTPKSTAL